MPAPALEIPVYPEPLPAVATVADAETEAESHKRFFWSAERMLQLEQALVTCTGTTVIERARQTAAERGWPEASVRSKLYEMQRLRRSGQPTAREAESTPVAKEEDRREATLP